MTEPVSWALIFDTLHTSHAIIDGKKRSELLKKIKLLIRKNRKIVLFGISGAGKSQFINSLKKHLEIPDRTLTTDKVKHEIEDFPIMFIDTPGHSERSFQRSQQITSIIKNGCEGIINVISNGYEENPNVDLNNIFSPNGEVKESFLKLNRKAEIERLAEWLPLIHPNNISWIINLVNKADIWSDKFSDVNHHYTKGEYYSAFKSIDAHTNVLTLPYCSLIKPYYNRNPLGLFGEIQKEQMQNNLIHQLLNLLKDEN
jgi:ABC-type dipeptide/oligopeptide/nickel transport system ATPase component